jgi:hypothetical protein
LATQGANAIGPVEAALADAVGRATAAGEWAAVAQLARELAARRTAQIASKVIPLKALFPMSCATEELLRHYG